MSSGQEDIRLLLTRVKHGDRSARKELFALLADERGLGAALVAIARRSLPRGHAARRLVETRDVLQSALMSGFRLFSQFHGASEGELYNWLRSIIHSKANRAVRRAKDRAPLDPSRAKTDGGTLERVVELELVEKVHRAVTKLPLDQRLVVELRLRGLETQEIADLLDLKAATVRKRESRAVARLRDRFDAAE